MGQVEQEGGFVWDVHRLRSELGRRIATSESPDLVSLRAAVLGGWDRYPEDQRLGLVTRLYGPDHDFRGALWELFWFHLCSRLNGHLPHVEWRNNNGTPKSVDFYLPQFADGVGIEVSCLSEHNAEVMRSFYMSDLLAELQKGVLAPHHYLGIRLLARTERLPDIRQVVRQVHDWVMDDLWVTVAASAKHGRLRLVMEDAGWIFDVEAVPTVAHWDATWLGFIGESGIINIGERIEERLRRKSVKSAAVVGLPFVIAIAETGDFVGSSRWHRVNALYGSDVIHLRADGTSTRGRGENGFFLGPTGWRNPSVSAVAFTGKQLPDFDQWEIEWWLNGGAAMELDAGLLAESGDVVSVRDEQLQILRRGSDTWAVTPVE